MPSAKPSTRDRILRVASALFSESGFHGTTTRQIAEQVGIQQPGLFHHFSSKEEIMRELQRIDFSASRAALEAAAALDVAPAVALTVALLLDGDRLVSSPYSFVSTVQPAVFNDPAFIDGRDRYEHTVQLQAHLIDRGIRSGDFVAVDAQLAAGALEWLFDGMLIDSERRGDDISGEQLINTFLFFALRAILTDPQAIDGIIGEARTIADSIAVPPA